MIPVVAELLTRRRGPPQVFRIAGGAFAMQAFLLPTTVVSCQLCDEPAPAGSPAAKRPAGA